jgi:hypothetical protein
MNEFFNWHDSWVLFEHNWIWLLLAFAIGGYIGWRTCEFVPDKSN